ncbi:ATPase [Aureococcus anophagefferens]|nr:ATPase [Aureococcus anophagefferens]
MFDGHYINNKSIPEGARWIKQLNFFNWGISAAARSELKGLGEMHGCRDPASQKCVFQRGDDAADYYGYHQTVRERSRRSRSSRVVMRFLGFLAFKYFFQDHPLFAPKPIPDDLPPEPAPEPAAPAPEDGPEDLEEPAEPPRAQRRPGRDARRLRPRRRGRDASYSDVLLCNFSSADRASPSFIDAPSK